MKCTPSVGGSSAPSGRDQLRDSARVIAARRAVTPDAGYGGVGVNVDFLVPNHRGRSCEAAMVAVGNERISS